MVPRFLPYLVASLDLNCVLHAIEDINVHLQGFSPRLLSQLFVWTKQFLQQEQEQSQSRQLQLSYWQWCALLRSLRGCQLELLYFIVLCFPLCFLAGHKQLF